MKYVKTPVFLFDQLCHHAQGIALENETEEHCQRMYFHSGDVLEDKE